MASQTEIPTLDGPFNSWKEVQTAQKNYEDFHSVQLVRRRATSVTAYRKKAPNRPINDELVNVAFQLECVKTGKYESKGTGARPKTNTIKTGCSFFMKFKMTPDGSSLYLADKCDQHNHPLSKKAFMDLPRQRRLEGAINQEVQKMLAVKASKVLIQQHVREATGQTVMLKDLHNKDRKRRPPGQSTVEDLVGAMKQQPGSLVDVMADEDGNLQAIYYQDEEMRKVFDAFPTLLLLDATYKLNNLSIPVYVMLVVDGNGQSEVVCVWLPVREDIVTLSYLMEKFKEMNPKWTEVGVVMTDKDATERAVIRQCLPDAKPLLCLYHVLNIFNREITTAKMDLVEEQRLTVLEILNKMAHSRCDDQVHSLFQQLKDLNIVKVTEYFETHWWNIREQWVVGLMDENMTLQTHTNNRLESLNNKFKRTVSKHSDMVVFFHDFIQSINSLRQERDHHALNMQQKIPLRPQYTWPAGYQYASLLTAYAFNFLIKQEQLVGKVVFEETTEDSATFNSSEGHIIVSAKMCQCTFWKSMNLPCRHIFAFRRHLGIEEYDPSLCSTRWTRSYYSAHHRVFTESAPNSPSIVSLAVTPRTKRVMSEQQKFGEASHVTNRLAKLLAKVPTREFREYLDVLKEIADIWSRGGRVSPVEVTMEEKENFPDPPISARRIVYLPDIAGTHSDGLGCEELVSLTELSAPDTCPKDIPTPAIHPELGHSNTEVAPEVGLLDTVDISEPASSLPLSSIRLPSLRLKRGRPRGSDTTVIGIPKKRNRQASGPNPILKPIKTCSMQNGNQVAHWCGQHRLAYPIIARQLCPQTPTSIA